MRNKSWFLSLAGSVLLLAPGTAPAQAPSSSTTTSGGTTTSTMSGGGTPASSGGGGGSVSNTTISGNSSISGASFNNLGPSPFSSMAPSNAIGTSNTNSISGRTTTGTGTNTTIPVPTTYNPWGSYYLNAYQPGLGYNLTGSQSSRSSNTGGPFGQPLYALQTATTTTSPTTATTQTQPIGFTTIGLIKAPAYVTALSSDFVVSRPTGGQLQQQLLAVLDRSSALRGQGNINLSVKGSEVTLKGQVSRDQLRRLAEGLVRMTPGVGEVRNELQVTPGKK